MNNNADVIFDNIQLNDYIYVANNPVNFVDPWGEDVIVFNQVNFPWNAPLDYGHNAIAIDNHYEDETWTMYSFSGFSSTNQVISSEKQLYEIYLKENEGSYDNFIKIKTFKTQDINMKKKADILMNKKYNIFFNHFHCGDFVDEVLNYGDIDIGKSKEYYGPNDKFEEILNANNIKECK